MKTKSSELLAIPDCNSCKQQGVYCLLLNQVLERTALMPSIWLLSPTSPQRKDDQTPKLNCSQLSRTPTNLAQLQPKYFHPGYLCGWTPKLCLLGRKERRVCLYLTCLVRDICHVGWIQLLRFVVMLQGRFKVFLLVGLVSQLLLFESLWKATKGPLNNS